MPEIISRKEALALGLKRYFTGKPCRNGHTDERKISTDDCMECQRERAMRCYYQNPKKKRIQVSAYSKANRAKRNEQWRKWSRANRSKIREYRRQDWLRHREEKLERNRAYSRIYQINGPKKPKGELQWLRKNQAQLRNVKRLLRRLSHGLPPSPS